MEKWHLTNGFTGQISAVTFCAKRRTKAAIKNLLGEPSVSCFMIELVLITILLICPTYFILKAKLQYGGIFSNNAGWASSSFIALMLLITYSIFIVVVGKDQLYSYCEYACKMRSGYIYEPTLIIIPSVGFSFAMYPYVGSEFLSSKNYSAINMFNMGWLVSIIGWFILVMLFLTLLVP